MRKKLNTTVSCHCHGGGKVAEVLAEDNVHADGRHPSGP